MERENFLPRFLLIVGLMRSDFYNHHVEIIFLRCAIVYNAIISNPQATRSDLIESLDISARTIDRAIKSLKEKGVLLRVGSDKAGHWEIIK